MVKVWSALGKVIVWIKIGFWGWRHIVVWLEMFLFVLMVIIITPVVR